jgi:hypothetical protein
VSQRKTTTKGRERGKREQLPQGRVRPWRLHLAAWVCFLQVSGPLTRRGGEGPTSTGQGLVNRIPLSPTRDDEMSLNKNGGF